MPDLCTRANKEQVAKMAPVFCTRANGIDSLPDLRTCELVFVTGVERSDDVGLGSLSNGQAAGGPA